MLHVLKILAKDSSVIYQSKPAPIEHIEWLATVIRNNCDYNRYYNMIVLKNDEDVISRVYSEEENPFDIIKAKSLLSKAVFSLSAFGNEKYGNSKELANEIKEFLATYLKII